ncbi:unnamed protein product [Lota lota]
MTIFLNNNNSLNPERTLPDASAEQLGGVLGSAAELKCSGRSQRPHPAELWVKLRGCETVDGQQSSARAKHFSARLPFVHRFSGQNEHAQTGRLSR